MLPKVTAPEQVTWLDQGLTTDQREKYYRTPQGSLIMPYSWFLALEQPEPGNYAPFAAEANLVRYNLVPDRSGYNPDHLPVGITRQTIESDHLEAMGCGAPPCRPGSKLHKDWLTYTCAACHVEQLSYKGKTIGVDGGRGRWNFTVFNEALANLLVATRYMPGMFDRFADKVIKLENRADLPEVKDAIQKELDEFLHGPTISGGILASLKHTYPTEEGYGRIDALGRGANGQFAPLDSRNVRLADAPVTIPPLWYTHDFDWVMSVGAIRQPLGRNITEAWGANSALDLVNPNVSKRFHTSVPVNHMVWLETLVSVMTPPKWPEEVFGKVDRSLAEQGRYLYEEKVFEGALTPADEQWCADDNRPGSYEACPNPNTPSKGLCARCHGAVASSSANENGKIYWQLPLYNLNVIGTDPADAVNFNARKVYTGVLKNQFGGRDQVSLGEALRATTSETMAREFEHQHIKPDDRPSVTGYRNNDFRAPLAYPARPLVGYWATPPFLHNGSVPNLYELLSPVSERSTIFWSGNSEFDPVKIGYDSHEFEGGFKFQTRWSFFGATGNSVREFFAGRPAYTRDVAGNSNLGHEFRNAPKGTKGVIGPYLSPAERAAIMEYMKVMPELKPTDGGAEFNRRLALLTSMEAQYKRTHVRGRPANLQTPQRKT